MAMVKIVEAGATLVSQVGGKVCVYGQGKDCGGGGNVCEPGVVGAYCEVWRGRGEHEGQDGLFVKGVDGESEDPGETWVPGGRFFFGLLYQAVCLFVCSLLLFLQMDAVQFSAFCLL